MAFFSRYFVLKLLLHFHKIHLQANIMFKKEQVNGRILGAFLIKVFKQLFCENKVEPERRV